MAVTVLSWAEQAVGQEQVVGVCANEKGLTDAFLDRVNLGNNIVDNELQILGVLSGDLGTTSHDIGGDSHRGRGSRAEDAEGEGGEDGEAERAHYEWVMSVGGKESDLVWKETERERKSR